MKKSLIWIASVIAACSACVQKSDRAEKPVLIVSIEPQRKLLEAVAGPQFEVSAIMPVGTNPETFEPTVAQRMRAADADAYFPIGYLPFEAALEKEMNGRSVSTTSGIEPMIGTHDHGDHKHEVPDPHVWTSVRNCSAIAAEMARQLGDLYPDQKQYFMHRADSLAGALHALDTEIAEKLAASHKSFMVWHPSLSYFARDYGLKQIAVGQESKEASMSQVAALIEEAKADSVSVFFFQKEYDSRQARNLSDEIGARIVEINPLAYDWEAELMRIADELAKH